MPYTDIHVGMSVVIMIVLMSSLSLSLSGLWFCMHMCWSHCDSIAASFISSVTKCFWSVIIITSLVYFSVILALTLLSFSLIGPSMKLCIMLPFLSLAIGLGFEYLLV